jgi:1-deoxy-D-xylulose-5-phosphate reductoisomerase
MSTTRKGVAILGATGSIGESTLDVIARHPERFHIVVLAARQNMERLRAQCLRHAPDFAVMVDADAAARLATELKSAGSPTRVVPAAMLDDLVAASDVDYVMAAIVGAAGLRPTLAAARAGKRILLANKESLVMSGALFMQAVKEGGATLIPIDSEHNAIFQCFPNERNAGVSRILLTASGGPFLRKTAAALAHVTPDEACAHPRWVMGRKISVDSATLMNKGLELIEASLLFDMPPEKIEVVVHPQSIVHSMVEYVDGSVLAQLGNPDMRTPIAYGLGWPERLHSGVESLNLIQVGRLEFEAPDVERFRCLKLARSAAQAGGTAPTVLNAANEVAVAAFLEERLAFIAIPHVIEAVLDQHSHAAVRSLEDVMTADAWARQEARKRLATVTGECA